MDKFLLATRKGNNGRQAKHAVRDYAMMLLIYRHGLRVSELTDMKLNQIDLNAGTVWIERKKGSLSTQQPLRGDEIRALRAWYRVRDQHSMKHLPYVFLSERGPFTRQAINYLCDEIGKRAELSIHVNPHMLRHSTGFTLANKGYDTRILQDFLGHKNIQHTVRYTATAAARFEGLWD